MNWFLSTLFQMLPVLLILAPLVLYATEAIAIVFILIIVVFAVGLRFWAYFSLLTNGNLRPFSYRGKRQVHSFKTSDVLRKEEERKTRGRFTPPRP
jgi:hypothetical protein